MNGFIIAEKVLALAAIALRVDVLVDEIKDFELSVNGDDSKLNDFVNSVLDREIDKTQQSIGKARLARNREI